MTPSEPQSLILIVACTAEVHLERVFRCIAHDRLRSHYWEIFK